jgi:hypothetical protein
MSSTNPLGFGSRRQVMDRDGERVEHVLVLRPLHRILAFTRRSIDDVVNDPIAKNEVLGYYKVYRQVARHAEVRDLERQWNPLGR